MSKWCILRNEKTKKKKGFKKSQQNVSAFLIVIVLNRE